MACCFKVIDQFDSLDAKAELSQHALRRGAIEGADQDKIGIEGNGGFGLPRQPPEGAGLVGHGRQFRLGRMRRKPDDLFGIGKGHHELIGAKVERHDPAWRIVGGGRAGKASPNKVRPS
jgi:hypothetical protein